MKTTEYFDYTRKRPDRELIREEWLYQAMFDRRWEMIQPDRRIRRWTWIEEEQKFLRAIFLEDGITLHNAFFDRRFKPEIRS